MACPMLIGMQWWLACSVPLAPSKPNRCLYSAFTARPCPPTKRQIHSRALARLWICHIAGYGRDACGCAISLANYRNGITKRNPFMVLLFDVRCPCFMADNAFSVQRYCGREERQVPAALSSGGLDGSLPQISAYLGNLGIPSAPSRLTLVFSSLSSAVVPRTEKVALPRSPERLHKREKN